MNQAQSLACPNCGSTMEVRMIGSNYKEGYCPVCDTRVDLSHTIPQQQTPQAINVHIPVASQQNTGNGAGVIVAITAALVVLIGGVVAFAVQTESSTSSGSSSISISEPIVSYSGGDLNSSAPSYVELKNADFAKVPAWLSTMTLSPDGTILAVAGRDSYVALLDSETLDIVTTFEGVNAESPIPPDIYSLAFSPNGTMLAVGSWGGSLELWDVETAQRTDRILIDEASTYNDIQFTSDGTQLIAATGKRNILVINIPEGDLALEIPLPIAPDTVAIVNDETQVAAGMGTRREIVVHDLTTGNQLRSITTADLINVVIASPDGTQIAVPGSDDIFIYDTTTWEINQTLSPVDQRIFSPDNILYSRDGKFLVASGFPRDGVIWNIETGVDLAHFEDVSNPEVMEFDFNTIRLFTIGGSYNANADVGDGNKVRIWDVESALAEDEPEVGDAEAIDETTE